MKIISYITFLELLINQFNIITFSKSHILLG